MYKFSPLWHTLGLLRLHEFTLHLSGCWQAMHNFTPCTRTWYYAIDNVDPFCQGIRPHGSYWESTCVKPFDEGNKISRFLSPELKQSLCSCSGKFGVLVGTDTKNIFKSLTFFKKQILKMNCWCLIFVSILFWVSFLKFLALSRWDSFWHIGIHIELKFLQNLGVPVR